MDLLSPNYQFYENLNGKERKQAIQDFLLALDSLNYNPNTYKQKIGKSFKNEFEANRFLNFLQDEMNIYNASHQTKSDLYLYVDYKTLDNHEELGKYTVWIVDFSKKNAIRKEIISRLLVHQIGSEPHTVLIRSKDSDFLKLMAKKVLKDLVKPFKLKMESRYLTNTPHITYFTIFTDTINQCECFGFESTSENDYIKI